MHAAMSRLLIFETDHWRVSHRNDARYPGYLMVSSREQHADLHALSLDALKELGPVLKRAESLLRSAYRPFKVVFYKLGFSAGFSCHFHVAPVTADLLAEIARHPDYADDPDGNDAILFLSRIYCERELTATESRDMENTVERLKQLHAIMEPDNDPPAPAR
jgi:diadenosine tetraphosphate (Ap4A) HIT family hydrolase